MILLMHAGKLTELFQREISVLSEEVSTRDGRLEKLNEVSNTQLKTIENLAEKGEQKAVQIDQLKAEVRSLTVCMDCIFNFEPVIIVDFF